MGDTEAIFEQAEVRKAQQKVQVEKDLAAKQVEARLLFDEMHNKIYDMAEVAPENRQTQKEV